MRKLGHTGGAEESWPRCEVGNKAGSCVCVNLEVGSTQGKPERERDLMKHKGTAGAGDGGRQSWYTGGQKARLRVVSQEWGGWQK